MLSRSELFEELSKYDKNVASLVADVFIDINDLLIELSISDIGIDKAEKQLVKAWEKALDKGDFEKVIFDDTADIVALASFESTVIPVGISQYTKDLLDVRIHPRAVGLKLSEQIRKTLGDTIGDQRRILIKSLNEGRSIANITKELLTSDTFETQLPKYLTQLQKSRIAGKKITRLQVRNAKKYINKIKTPSLKRSYTGLIEAIELGGSITKSTNEAIQAKTVDLSRRTAQTESVSAIVGIDADMNLIDPDVNTVEIVNFGRNPCARCKAMAKLGEMPIASCELPTYHPRCTCKPIYYIRDNVEPWSNDTFQKKIVSAESKVFQETGLKTYLDLPVALNLRKSSLTRRLGYNKISA